MAETIPGDAAASPFHPGELAVQERMGVREKIGRQASRSIRPFMTTQHRDFFGQLAYAFVGSVDAAGQPWASMLVGTAGFMTSPDAYTLEVGALPLSGDILHGTLHPGAPLALLGVQLPTRRRNRVIGRVAHAGPAGFGIAVQQTMGVCPQYIQGREASFARRDPPPPPRRTPSLDAAARAIVAKADTFFVASIDPAPGHGAAGGADISHRGGRPGFVRIDDDTTLTTPDFVGNFIFNTLGNFQVDNRAGLLFVDFETGDTLQMAARAEVVWDGPEVAAFAGAQRLVRYHLTEVVRIERAVPLAFSAPDMSPLLDRTGSWPDAAAALDAEASRTTWRPFRIEQVDDEGAAIRSFTLAPADGKGMPLWRAGQFLPIRVQPPGWAAPVTRTYTISTAPGGACRLSVKRTGSGGVSDWLHDSARPGTTIEAMAPRGSFVFDTPPDRPAVLVSAGVGITPMLAMLDDLMVNEGRTRHHAPLWFIHGARNGGTLAFGVHLRRKAAQHGNLAVHVALSHPAPEDIPGRTYQSEGRIDLALLKAMLPFDDYDFYVCGPQGFMQDLYEGLTGMGVREARIHLESFGPSSIRRPVAPAASGEEAVAVTFAASGKVARWRPSDGSLLDLAEREGCAPLSSCRSGVCGTCATRVVAGAVEYLHPPVHDVAPGEALICVARPHAGPHLADRADCEGVVLDL